jgi:4-hydroxybenzoate polyprenyltransferase
MPAALRLLRPSHWTKNLTAFAGVVFGGRLGEPWAIAVDFAVFVVLCAASSAVYVVNDLCDVEYDRAHPTKRHRPIASGEVAVGTARALAAALAVGSVVASFFFGFGASLCVIAYLVLNLAYSFRLKHVFLIDVLCIALGFALRVLAGIYALGDLPTAWIVLCAFFLALFLGFGKRRTEIGDGASERDVRPVLENYDRGMLDSLLDGSAATAILTYALFTATSGKNPSLIVTVPIVWYAITYYRRLLETTGHGAEPEQILLRDRVIQTCVAVWLASFVVIAYGELHFFR